MAKNIGSLFSWVVGKIGVGTMVGFGHLFVMFSSVVWWLNQFTGSLASPSLGRTTLIALLLGWLLARSRLSGWQDASS